METIRNNAEAEEVLKSILDPKILIINKPDYTFNKVIEAMEVYTDKKLKQYNEKVNTKVELEKTDSAAVVFNRYFDPTKDAVEVSKQAIQAMEEYAESQSDLIHALFNNPCVELKPLEDLWRKENSPDRYVIPDRTAFYAWIREKLLNKIDYNYFEKYQHEAKEVSRLLMKLQGADMLSDVDHTFWNRLLLFVENVQVNDMMSHEEQEYIIGVAKKNKK